MFANFPRQKAQIMTKINIGNSQQHACHFFKLDAIAVLHLQSFLSQLIETYLDNPRAVQLVRLSRVEFDSLANCYRNLLVGYFHPRTDSLTKQIRMSDPTLRRLTCQPSHEKNLSK